MKPDTPDSSTNRHLGIRLTVGVVGLLLLALFVMLGQVAMKQSATNEALESYEALREDAAPAAVGE